MRNKTLIESVFAHSKNYVSDSSRDSLFRSSFDVDDFVHTLVWDKVYSTVYNSIDNCVWKQCYQATRTKSIN